MKKIATKQVNAAELLSEMQICIRENTAVEVRFSDDLELQYSWVFFSHMQFFLSFATYFYLSLWFATNIFYTIYDRIHAIAALTVM